MICSLCKAKDIPASRDRNGLFIGFFGYWERIYIAKYQDIVRVCPRNFLFHPFCVVQHVMETLFVGHPKFPEHCFLTCHKVLADIFPIERFNYRILRHCTAIVFLTGRVCSRARLCTVTGKSNPWRTQILFRLSVERFLPRQPFGDGSRLSLIKKRATRSLDCDCRLV